MPEVEVWQAVADELTAGGSCGLLVVAQAHPDHPLRRGMLMAVTRDGPMRGTIGGGPTEDELVARAAGSLREGALPAELVPVTPGPDDPWLSGPVDGSAPTVVVAPLTPSDLPGVRRMIEALSAGRPVEWCADPGGWRVVMEGLSPGIGLVGAARHWSYAQSSGPTHSVHLIGSGHVAAALAPLLMELEFRVVVVEERPSADAARVAAHERLRLAYEDLASVVPAGPTSFVAVLGHTISRDAAALAALEPLEFGYLGVLGTARAVRQLVGERPMPAWFHAPMGLPIGSATPAEIAVAVAAELVAVRSTGVERL